MIKNITTPIKEDIPEGERVDSEYVQRVLKKYHSSTDGLIPFLEDIQAKYGYLPAKAFRIVSEKTGRSLVDIYGVATFYRSFSLLPRGKHLVTVCLGTACHVRGAPKIAEEFQKNLKITAGQTTPDRQFTLETVNCLGACALGPVVVIDGHYFSKVKKTMVSQLLDDALKGFDKIDIKQDKRIFPLEVCCPRCNHNLMDKISTIDGHPSIKVNVSLDNQQGCLRMSSLYGSYNITCEIDLPAEQVVNFFCPHCQENLIGSSKCPMCEAPMVLMHVHNAGIVQICSRQGCKNHMLDLEQSRA